MERERFEIAFAKIPIDNGEGLYKGNTYGTTVLRRRAKVVAFVLGYQPDQS